MLSRTFLTGAASALALLVLAPMAGSAPDPPTIPGMALDFMEDFQTGIDPGVWYVEDVAGTHWTAATEGDNVYATCIGAQSVWSNREADLLTQRADFSCYVVMWDMRFLTESWDADYRQVYFRTTNDAVPIGYGATIGVGVPTGPPADRVAFWCANSPTDYHAVGPQVECPWDLNAWYTFKVQVMGQDFKMKMWPKGQIEPDAWFLEVTDTETGPAMGRFGFGNYWLAHTDVDNIYIYILSPTPTETTTWGGIKALYARP